MGLEIYGMLCSRFSALVIILKQNYLCDTKNFNVTLKECLCIQFNTKNVE
jgi:hypothetical protein